jgi:hypothetical protein
MIITRLSAFLIALKIGRLHQFKTNQLKDEKSVSYVPPCYGLYIHIILILGCCKGHCSFSIINKMKIGCNSCFTTLA